MNKHIPGKIPKTHPPLERRHCLNHSPKTAQSLAFKDARLQAHKASTQAKLTPTFKPAGVKIFRARLLVRPSQLGRLSSNLVHALDDNNETSRRPPSGPRWTDRQRYKRDYICKHGPGSHSPGPALNLPILQHTKKRATPQLPEEEETREREEKNKKKLRQADLCTPKSTQVNKSIAEPASGHMPPRGPPQIHNCHV